MAQAEIPTQSREYSLFNANNCSIDGQTPAAGLFGYSINNGRMMGFKPMIGYIREIEQMPNFSPPSVESFVTQYVAQYTKESESVS